MGETHVPHESLVQCGKKGEYIRGIICSRKVSFNKHSCTAAWKHVHKHNITIPSKLEKAVWLAKKCQQGGGP